MSLCIAFIVGLVFSFGLAIARLTQPQTILDFLDFTGAWYPGPLLVIGIGAASYAMAFRILRKRRRPLLATSWSLPTARHIDAPLIAGALLFGVGWGPGGYCPGPAITSLAYGKPETFVFVLAMILGAVLEAAVRRAALLRMPPARTLSTRLKQRLRHLLG